MAEQHQEYHRGEMDVAEQKATYSLFMALMKWSAVLSAATILGLCIWFATDAGFIPGALAFIVLLGLGAFMLRKKPGAEH